MSVVLVSRDGPRPQRLVREIRETGGRALAGEADIADEAAVEAVVAQDVLHFGRIDTWINTAGAAAYETLDAPPIAEHRHLSKTNDWASSKARSQPCGTSGRGRAAAGSSTSAR